MSLAEPARSFEDRLKATLILTIGGEAFPIAAGDLKEFSLSIEPWGFTGSAVFWFVAVAAQSEDTLFARFVEKDPIEVSLTLARAFDKVEEAARSMSVKGLITEKSVMERPLPDVSGAPVLQRRYFIRFEDRGGVLFGQHQPIALYVDKSYKELISANKPPSVALEFAWPAAEKKHPVLSLSLGAGGDASFRDFLSWLLHKENAALYYDTATDKYRISDKKPAGAKAKKILKSTVASLEAYFPPLRRGSISVLNASTEAATKKKDVKNDQGVAGVRADHLIRSAVAGHLDARVTLETARGAQPEPQAAVSFRVFPTTPLLPSMKVELEEGFGGNVYQHKKAYRVVRTRVAGEALRKDATDDNGQETNSYRIDYALLLELATDPVVRVPPFQRPAWPFCVEGKVVSEVGEQKQGTYQVYKEAETSIDVYRVKVPLFADQKVIVPYEPSYQSGHFYFPAYKDARVLLELDFDRARIRAFLDFRPGARLPEGTQGNQILVGKGKKDETSIRHVYDEGKPKLVIERTMDKDHQVITVSEGTIRFETHETKGS